MTSSAPTDLFAIPDTSPLTSGFRRHERSTSFSRCCPSQQRSPRQIPLEPAESTTPVKTRSQFVLPLLAGLALGCGLEIPEIAGKWSGTDNDADRWEPELTENESGLLSGTYTLQIVGSLTLRDSVAGRYEYPVVSWDLEISIPGSPVQRCSFRGTMAESGQSFAGTVTCTGGGVADWTSPLDFQRTT